MGAKDNKGLVPLRARSDRDRNAPARVWKPVEARLRMGELEQARCAWLLACDLAGAAFDADLRVLVLTSGKVGRGSDNLTSKARKVACYLALVVANVSCVRLAEAAQVDRATINKHAAWVEDARDDPDFDAKVQVLEEALVRMALRVVMGRLGDAAPEVAA